MNSFIEEVKSRPKTYSLMFLLFLSYFTVVHNFWNPQALFWDENYHIASAQKYLNGVYFMEPHPPLGKLLIALGEKIVHANAQDNQFIATDYATNPPPGFNFIGYRLFPVLLAWMLVPVLFGIFFFLTKRVFAATVFTLLYVFDNALMVHLRSAMLESTLLFFGSLTVLAFLLLLEWRHDRKKFMWASILFGVAFACTLDTKDNGLIFILLVPALLWAFRKNLKQFWRFAWMSFVPFLIVYCGIWQLHFGIASTVNPSLPDNGYYQASAQYKEILQNHATWSPLSFPVMMVDSINFVTHYQKGVPRLNMCKADENGSPWFYWPFGARTINYRWETPDGGAYRYLYLVPNPIVWGLAFLGLLLSVVLLLGSLLMPLMQKLKQPYLLTTFFVLYAGYMFAMSRITRVMYLYHYFIPLFFTFFLLALAFEEIESLGAWKLTEHRKNALLLGAAALMFAAFQFYRPFTYYTLITDSEFQQRNLLQVWDFHCVHCQLNDPLVVPGANS